MLDTITKHTHLTDRSDVEDFCQYVAIHDIDYDAETKFSGDHSLSEEEKTNMNRLAEEAIAILSNEGADFEEELTKARQIHIHQIQERMQRVRELANRRHLRITGSGAY